MTPEGTTKRVYFCMPIDLPLIEPRLRLPGVSCCGYDQSYMNQKGNYQMLPSALVQLRQSEEVVFVMSKSSACSTAFQVLLMSVIPETKTKLQSRLIFDKAPIPGGAGLCELRSLPDVNSAHYQLRLFLHRMFRKLAA